MSYSEADRVAIDVAGYGVPKGSVGTVNKVYANGNLRLRVTHGPGCVPRDVHKTIPSVAPEDVSRSTCVE